MMIKTTVVAAIALMLLLGCEKDYSFGGDENGVAFSTDTLKFGDVFTDELTPTTSFKIYNRSGKDMTIAKVILAGGNQSPFAVNINGASATEATSLQINDGDSLYVFVRLNVGSNAVVEPFSISDSVVVYTSKSVQSVQLQAIAQNVKRISGTISDVTLSGNYLVTNDIVFENKVSIDTGSHIYVNAGASILVRGNLSVNGSPDNPVSFSTSRRDKWYSTIPGQWQGIELSNGSFAYFSCAIIDNATTSIKIDAGASISSISGCRIRYASEYGIFANNSNLSIDNSLISNCGRALIAAYCGNYSFTHCTLANFPSWTSNYTSAIHLYDYYTSDSEDEKISGDISMAMLNTILYGSRSNDVTIDFEKHELSDLNFNSSYSLLRINNLVSANAKLESVILDKNPLYVNSKEADFCLSAESPAINAGNPSAISQYPIDLNGNLRSDGAPDMGAFEFFAE